jgi:putative acetyltransferase
MTNIENRQHIIIEGCYIPPEHINDFEPEYLEQIIAFYIGFSKNYLERHFTSGIIEHMSEIEQKDYDDYINPNNLIKLHTQLKELCKKCNAPFFEIDDDYTGEMALVYNWVDEQVKSKRMA